MRAAGSLDIKFESRSSSLCGLAKRSKQDLGQINRALTIKIGPKTLFIQ